MKNKLLGLLLCGLLCIGLFPAQVFAAGVNEGLIVNGVDITTAQDYTVVCVEGKAIYNPQEQKLTLDNAEITVGAKASSTAGERYGVAIQGGITGTVEVVLNGKNSIILSDTQYKNMGIWAAGSSLKFSGGGSLEVSLYNDSFPSIIQGRNLEFEKVDITGRLLNEESPCGYAVRTTGTVISNQSAFEITGFETAIDTGSLAMRNGSSLNVKTSAEYGMGVFSGDILVEDSQMDLQVPDTGLYCLAGNLTVSRSSIVCSQANVGMYAEEGIITVKEDSMLNLNNKIYGLRIYNGSLSISGGVIHASGSRGGIQVLNVKEDETDTPTVAIFMAPDWSEEAGGNAAAAECLYDDGYDEPYPVFITTFISAEDSILNEDLSNAVTSVQIQIKGADYSRVEEMIEKAKALNKDEYKDFSKVEAAIDAVIYGKNIKEQGLVDDMAEAIEDAISSLEKKLDTDIPQTGDNGMIIWIAIMLAAGAGLSGTVICGRKIKRSR